MLSGDLKASLRIAAEKSIHKMSSNEDEFLEGIWWQYITYSIWYMINCEGKVELETVIL